MDICILYFSPTGTCKALAESMAKPLPAAGTLVADITRPETREALLRKPIQAELLIVVFPVYSHRLPEPAAAFLRQSRLSCKRAAAVCAYGRVSPGNALASFARLLQNKGVQTVFGAEIPTRHSYECLFPAFRPRPLSAASPIPWGELVGQASTKSAPMRPPRRITPAPLFPQTLLAHWAVTPPRTAQAACTRCGRCRPACPVGAIGGNLETDRRACIRCAACIRICPAHARSVRFLSLIPALYLSLHWKRPKSPRLYW